VFALLFLFNCSLYIPCVHHIHTYIHTYIHIRISKSQYFFSFGYIFFLQRKILGCEANGQLTVWNDIDPSTSSTTTVASRNTILLEHYQRTNSKQRTELIACKSDFDQKYLATIALGWPLCVWDLSRMLEGGTRSESLIWRAKNVPPDKKLKQRVPWVDTDVTWSGSPPLLFVTTRTGHLRVFDIRAQRRPVNNYHLAVHRADTSGGPDVIAQGYDVSLTHVRLSPSPTAEPTRGVVTDPLANLWEFDRRGTHKGFFSLSPSHTDSHSHSHSQSY
jgi:hypothetical protein